MKDLSQLISESCQWMDCSGPFSDIVISSRIRLARNVSGFLFSPRSDQKQQQEVLEYVRQKLMDTELYDHLLFLSMKELSGLEKQLLAERQLISRQFADGDDVRGVAVSHDQSLSLMINEEDHIRLQLLASGLQLDEAYQQIDRIDDVMEERIDYVFSSQYGYLTACPTNVGTGIRVSVMMHLPALKITGQIEKIFWAAKEMHLAIRGLYGEGTEPIGDLYQLSNQTTLGRSERQIIDQMIHQAVEPIIEYERRARQKLLKNREAALDDKIFRALGNLQNARLVTSEEAGYMLSLVRLGIHLERLEDLTLSSINDLFLITQPAHLQHFYQQTLSPQERDQKRAELIRSRLN